MKNRLLITALLVMMAMTSQAQRLVPTQQAVDCGKSGYQLPVTATFELKNKGSKRLVIEDVKTDCGCTKGEISKRELASGDVCTVKVIYDGRMLGHFAKNAMVTYHLKHSPNQSEVPVLLTMRGVVLSEIKDYSGIYPYAMGELLADQNVLEFDDVNKGDHPEQEIHILNNSLKTMTPNIQHLPSYMTATVTPEQLKPGQAGKIVITLNSEDVHDLGLSQASVYLASNLGEKISPDNELPVSVVLLPDLTTFAGKNKQYAPKMELSASSILLGKIDGKQRKKAELIITNKGRMPLDISSIQMFTGGLQLTLNQKTLQPGQQTKMKIVGDIEWLKKQKTKPRILMITNDPDKSKLIIPVIVK